MKFLQLKIFCVLSNLVVVIKLKLLREPRIDDYVGRGPNLNTVESPLTGSPMQGSSRAVQYGSR